MSKMQICGCGIVAAIHAQGPFEVVPITDPHDGGGSVEEAQRVILDRLKDLGDGEGA